MFCIHFEFGTKVTLFYKTQTKNDVFFHFMIKSSQKPFLTPLFLTY